MARKNYRTCVRMGNWNEDIFLEEEMMKDFLEKRDKGQLLIQRNRILIANLLRKTTLSVIEDGLIHYGDKVLIMNPDYTDPSGGQVVFGRLALAVTPEEMKAHMSNEIEVPCEVTAMPDVKPIGRNTFIILSLDENALGKTVRYGQNFGLATTAGFDHKMFYLGSSLKTPVNSTKKSALQEVHLTDEFSFFTCWQAAYFDPRLRIEYDDFPVPANAKIVIKHCHTNQALAANRKYSLRTYFGKECEVACHTHIDCYKTEKPLNHWVLCTGDPNDHSSIVLDRGNPLEKKMVPEQPVVNTDAPIINITGQNPFPLPYASKEENCNF
ncbi:cilia- and flagella-associated protein 161 isoform X1 [Sarcophilus harrisii]|uniref:Cilia and flagella associated protein 161 n=1 Tax=Sarcophilus harrisii TaxID=9305 RepID=A0A7N4NKT1_SARHA|nr:cilia- and flagella-associated protein 161 isoform X1 [Sarcophilus harrisii]